MCVGLWTADALRNAETGHALFNGGENALAGGNGDSRASHKWSLAACARRAAASDADPAHRSSAQVGRVHTHAWLPMERMTAARIWKPGRLCRTRHAPHR